MKRWILGLAALGLLHGGMGQAKAGVLGVDFASTNPVNFGSSTWNLGFEFQANRNATVIGLGNVDLTGSGYTQPQQVGLWTSTGTLLASTFVDSSDPLVGADANWRFHSIGPVTLVAGADYAVGGQGGADYTGEVPVNVSSNITYLKDLYVYNAGLNTPLAFPVESEGYTTSGSAGWFGGNLEFGQASAVPEPASVALLGIGIGGLAGYGCRRRKLAATNSAGT